MIFKNAFSKKILALSAAAVCALSINCFSVSAAEIPANIPTEVCEYSEEVGQPIVELQEGVYKVGDCTFIDVETIEFVPNNEDTIGTRGKDPPPTNSVWDWSKGDYKATFECKIRIYTSYRFLGYSKYCVDATAYYEEPTHVNSGHFSINVVKGNSETGTKGFIDNGSGTCCFINCDPTEKYAFSISKTNDGFLMQGRLTVSGKESS